MAEQQKRTSRNMKSKTPQPITDYGRPATGPGIGRSRVGGFDD